MADERDETKKASCKTKKTAKKRTRQTREEKNASRRERRKDPFLNALYLRTARKWRAKNKERIREQKRQRREADPEYRQSLRDYAKKYYREHREACAARIKRWTVENREYRKKWYEDYMASEAGKAKIRRSYEAKIAKYNTDEEYRKRQRENARKSRLRRLSDPEYFERMIREKYIPHWEKVVEAGEFRVKIYATHARGEIKRRFVKWYCSRQLIDREKPHSEFVVPEGAEVAEEEILIQESRNQSHP